MTAYFDELTTRLRKVTDDIDAPGAADEIGAIEQQIVDDVALACELPGFPAALRDAATRAVLAHSVTTRPAGWPWPSRVQDDADMAREVGWLISDLHGIFHAVAHQTDHLTDSPLRGAMNLRDDFWDRVEALRDLPDDTPRAAAITEAPSAPIVPIVPTEGDPT
jgi:hypothetical protein